MRSYFAWHIADNLQDLDRQPLFQNIFQSHSSVDHTCKDCWYRVITLCDPMQSHLCVCREKARCTPKCCGVVTLCLHGKGSMQSQVFWRHHFMFAWKMLDASPCDLDIVQHGVYDPMQSSLYGCMDKA